MENNGKLLGWQSCIVERLVRHRKVHCWLSHTPVRWPEGELDECLSAERVPRSHLLVFAFALAHCCKCASAMAPEWRKR